MISNTVAKAILPTDVKNRSLPVSYWSSGSCIPTFYSRTDKAVFIQSSGSVQGKIEKGGKEKGQ
jgi:hypothetical protein